MKKFTKAGLIISGAVFASGIAFGVISLILGGSPRHIKDSFDRMNFSWGWGKNVVTLGETLSEPIELHERMNLSIDVGGAEVEFVTSEDGKFYAESEGINMKWNTKGNEVILQAGSRVISNTNAGEVTIYIPDKYKFGEVEIECGAGTIRADALSADDIELELGAGEIKISNIDTRALDISCGAGSVEIRGSISGDADIECSMGEIYLAIDQAEEEFNYELECSMGEISINGDKYEGFGNEKEIDNGADKTMNLECSMGEIRLETK